MRKPVSLEGEQSDLDETRAICGLDVAVASGDDAVRAIQTRLDRRIATRVAFLNAHCVNLAYSWEDYRRSLEGFLILPDGLGIDLASQFLHGASFPENLTGTDFVPFLLTRLTKPVRIALIGSVEGVAERAAAAFAAQMPHHTFIPVAHGYFAAGGETEAVLVRLRAAQADIVLVALGVPRQELFIARHIGAKEATVAIAVGALLDFMAGKVSRAPRFLRKLRLEWVYRMLMEPRRLWRRYLIGNPRFLAHVLAKRRRRAGQRSR